MANFLGVKLSEILSVTASKFYLDSASRFDVGYLMRNHPFSPCQESEDA